MSKTKESKFLVVGQNILLYSDEETDDSGTGRSGSGFEEEGGGDRQEEEEGSEESTEDGDDDDSDEIMDEGGFEDEPFEKTGVLANDGENSIDASTAEAVPDDEDIKTAHQDDDPYKPRSTSFHDTTKKAALIICCCCLILGAVGVVLGVVLSGSDNDIKPKDVFPEPTAAPSPAPIVQDTPAPSVTASGDPTLSPSGFPSSTTTPTTTPGPTIFVPEEVKLSADADTYITIGGVDDGSNHGDEGFLLVQRGSEGLNTTNTTAYSLISFNLTDIPHPSNIFEREKTAILKLEHLSSTVDRATATLTISRLPSMRIAIDTLTGDSFTASGGTLGPTFEVPSNATTIEVDISDLLFGQVLFVRRTQEKQQQQLFLMIENRGPDQEVGDLFRSLESPNPPELIVGLAKPRSESPTTSPAPTSSPSSSLVPSSSARPTPAPSGLLGECEGDCDKDSDCADGLVCHQKNANQIVPGCFGGEKEATRTDFCVVALPTAPPYFLPTPPDGIVTYHPGNLTTFKDRLLLSEGLDSKLLATSEKTVKFNNGSESTIDFHGRPDAGATFPDTRAHNVGGWVYVSNSEMPVNGTGGVGAITFDKDGSMIDYQMVLEGSTWNCGGGKTPWNTWVSCEELPGGKIFQVDPFGTKSAEEMTLGSSEGSWESFAYDIRDPKVPRFYATEDTVTGALERFTPTNPDWNYTWEMLHGPGTIDYLILQPSQDGSSNGTFVWTTNRASAKQNAMQNYPHSEGIDVYGNELFFVCKQIRMLFVLDLDARTYMSSSTESGLFDGGPDQLKRIINDEDGLLYFTEDGGVDSGIHARDTQGRFYTILESPILPGETAGLAFSPDGKFMYVAYQDVGMLYAIWRRDGFPFHATHLDVKYHQGT